MGNKTIIALVAALTLALGACAKKGEGECKAWVEKTAQCDEDMKTASGDELSQGKDLLQQICVEAMSGKDPGGEGDGAEMAKQMIAAVRKKVVCAQKTTCDEFNACEAAADK